MDGVKLPAEIERDNLNVRLDRIEQKIDMLLARSFTPPPKEALLDVCGVSKRCKVSTQTIYNWVSLHKIPCHKLNGKLLFVVEEVDDFLQAER